MDATPLGLKAGRPNGRSVIGTMHPKTRLRRGSQGRAAAAGCLRKSAQGTAAAVELEVEVTAVRVLDLGFRWGSCGKGGGVNFHWAVILLPPRIVDYVIVHELVHLHEQHHTPEFWRRVERAMPDFERRKQWLARHGGSHLAL